MKRFILGICAITFVAILSFQHQDLNKQASDHCPPNIAAKNVI
ncbi:hypothetical protein EV207_12836 [Scopulibacillus darangshiensis]|uniref:Uncharacterized protein n=1 Tax=Scopulibacillus darangshiensis TaxID=442528 RepID=A0A4R2NPR3_9BACL|nr:hypothetical protein [Scopulibacillus darangshiensis]TCP23813.1 hypothetical protein EV207_12836 [Scopulibacillus darangshiensis]